MGTAGRTAPAMRKTQGELNTDLNLSRAALQPAKPRPASLTSIAQDGRPGLPVGHQALRRLMWVGKSWGQAWGEYNTDRSVNYCGEERADKNSRSGA